MDTKHLLCVAKSDSGGNACFLHLELDGDRARFQVSREVFDRVTVHSYVEVDATLSLAEAGAKIEVRFP